MSYWYVGVLKAGIQDGIVNRFVEFIDCNVFLKYSVQIVSLKVGSIFFGFSINRLTYFHKSDFIISF